PPGAPVNIAIAINRRVPMAFQALGPSLVRVGPDFLDAIRSEFQACRADAIALGDQDFVAHDRGIAGIDAFEQSCPPGIVKEFLPGLRVKAKQAAACEVQSESLAVNCGDNGTRITRKVVPDPPSLLSREFVECDQGSAVAFSIHEVA